MILILNNSQNAGCILRSPYSHCAQERNEVCKSAAHCACVRPAAARTETISSGCGLRSALPTRLRLGWLLIENLLDQLKSQPGYRRSLKQKGCRGIALCLPAFLTKQQILSLRFLQILGLYAPANFLKNLQSFQLFREFRRHGASIPRHYIRGHKLHLLLQLKDFLIDLHSFYSPCATVPEARLSFDSANYMRNAHKCKRFLINI